MKQHNFTTFITINDIEYSLGPVFYAYYKHKDIWKESASITNLYLQELKQRTQHNESIGFS